AVASAVPSVALIAMTSFSSGAQGYRRWLRLRTRRGRGRPGWRRWSGAVPVRTLTVTAASWWSAAGRVLDHRVVHERLAQRHVHGLPARDCGGTMLRGCR